MRLRPPVYMGVLAIPALMAVYAIFGGGIGDASWMGLTVEEMSPEEEIRIGIPGNLGHLVVVQVEGPVSTSGVMVRDVLVGINGLQVDTRNEFLTAARNAMESRGPDGRIGDVVLTLNRFGRSLTAIVPSEVVEAQAL